jgi:hypothetical protein
MSNGTLLIFVLRSVSAAITLTDERAGGGVGGGERQKSDTLRP